MGTYTPSQTSLPVGLDGAGLRLGLQRVDSEPLHDYRQRLLAEIRDPADPSQDSYIRGIGRKIAALDAPLLRVDLVVDSDGEPAAPDPYVEVTSNYFRAYSDYDNSTLDFEVFFGDRSSGYWLVDLKAAFAGSLYFTAIELPDYSAYFRSDRIRYGNSLAFEPYFPLFKSYQNNLLKKYIKSVHFLDGVVFKNKVDTVAEVTSIGDYYIDYTNGVVIGSDVALGAASFSYRKFPYDLYGQSVRAVPYSDDDLKYSHSTSLVSDSTGTDVWVNLAPTGARIANAVLAPHPLGWGR